MKFSGKVYDVLKWLCLIAIPATGSLYFGLAKIWGFPFGIEVVGTLDLIAAFIGTLIGVSTRNYNKDKEENIADGKENAK